MNTKTYEYINQETMGTQLFRIVSCSNECDVCFRAVMTFKTHLGMWQKSNFNLVKIHAMKHYLSSICCSRAPIEYSSNMYKNLYIAMVKIVYWASNKKQFLDFIVKYNRRLEALQMSTLEKDGYSPRLEKI